MKKEIKKSQIQLIPVLFNIRSIHNVGSIFRTADGMGCEEIILVGYTPSPFDRLFNIREDFKKTALGAEKNFVIKYFARIGGAIRALKKEGYFVIALEQDSNSISYNMFHKKFPQAKKIALILGNEPEGISKNVLKEVDAIIEIPMQGAKESLNVSVAFGIAGYSLIKK